MQRLMLKTLRKKHRFRYALRPAYKIRQDPAYCFREELLYPPETILATRL